MNKNHTWSFFSGNFVRKLESNGFKRPTPVQKKSIPEILKGKSLRVVSPAGSGKTLAYLLPSLVIAKNKTVLVIVPTRELAFQVNQMLQKINPNREVVSSVITSGKEVHKKARDIVVATPGKLLEAIHDQKKPVKF